MKTEFDDTVNEALSIARVSVSVTDLRIGNLVYKCYPDGKETTIVEKISKHFINGLGISAIEPILLTDKLLLKLGFIEVDYAGGCYQKEDITIDMADFNCCYKRDWLEIDVKYVHQLQNLYHALNGSELQIGDLTEH